MHPLHERRLVQDRVWWHVRPPKGLTGRADCLQPLLGSAGRRRAAAKIGEDRLYTSMFQAAPSAESEMPVDLSDLPAHELFGHVQRLRDPGIAQTLRHKGEHVML